MKAEAVKGHRWVGRNLPREDGAEKATGTGAFVTDIHLPNMLHGKYFRGRLPHALILNVDVSKALKVRGVKAVLTAKDCPKDGDGNLLGFGPVVLDYPILAQKKVRYVGEPIAAVAATDEDAAAEAVELIEADYEELPAVFDPREALKPDAPLVHEDLERYTHVPHFKPIRYGNVAYRVKVLKGNPGKAFEEADHVLEQEFGTSTHHQCYLEPHAVVAQVDVKGKVTAWTSTQTVAETRQGLSDTLAIHPSRIRVIAPFIGGGFGGKLSVRIEPHAILLARMTGRPVKIVLTREEEFISGHPRHPFRLKYKTGVMKDGRITAREIRFIADSGAYAHQGPGVVGTAASRAQGPYHVPHVRVDGSLVYTNKVPFGGYRGYGGPQVHFAGESQLDDLAAEIGIDPIELRMKNGMTTGGRLLTGQSTPHAAYQETLRRTAAATGWDWENRKKPAPKPRDPRKKTGIGVSSMEHGSAIYASSAIVKMESGGGLTVMAGGTEIGAGQRTIFAQIAAEALSVPIERISIVLSDTLTAPYDWSTDASRTTYNTGNAIVRAAAEVREQFLEIAGKMLEADPKDLEMDGGEVYVKSAPDRRAGYDAVVTYGHYVDGGVILGKGTHFDPPEYDPPEDLQVEGWHFTSRPALIYGTQIAQVEVDTETGRVEVISIHSAHDIGQAISPVGCEGQIEGGVSVGVGWACSEEMVFENGAVTNPTLLDYKIPTTLDMPEVHSILVEDPDPTGPFGAKGIGEPTLISTAAAVANAIRDAVGVRIQEMPFSPARVLAALQKAASE